MKNPLKQFFMNCSLKTRIIILYTLLAIALIGGITFYAYHFAVNALQEKETSILKDSTEYLGKEMNTRMKAINEEYINLFYNTEFVELYLKTKYTDGSHTQNLVLSNELRDYFFSIRMRNTDLVKYILLAADNRYVYTDSNGLELDYTQFVQTPYYPEAMNNKNKIIYRNMEPDKDYFCLMRSFYYQAGSNPGSAFPAVGYQSNNNEDYTTLVFYLKKDYFKKLIREEAVKRRTGVMILDQDGAIVVSDGDIAWLDESGMVKAVQYLRSRAGENAPVSVNSREVGLYSYDIEPMGWKVVQIYDMGILYEEVGQIRSLALYAFLIAVLIVIFIASFISHTVVSPIRSLAKSMDTAIVNNFVVDFEPKYNDEVAELSKSFRLLMGRISDLMDDIEFIEVQKRTEELKALQAQINPHFLYNTLDTVYWLAKMEGNDQVADLISDLADFFRLSLNKGEDITTVARETEHASKYLDIQKMRMNGNFDYEVHVEESLKEKRIPKLILQPFVENSLIHGFEGITYPGRITIDVTSGQEQILFCITDNGKGLTPEMATRLNQSEKITEKDHGYAIKNVRERILLYSDSAYGVHFDEDYQGGTRAWISFPMELRVKGEKLYDQAAAR